MKKHQLLTLGAWTLALSFAAGAALADKPAGDRPPHAKDGKPEGKPGDHLGKPDKDGMGPKGEHGKPEADGTGGKPGDGARPHAHGDGFRNALFENPGNANRFLTLELEGTRSTRSAYGARITVRVRTEDGPRSMHRAVGSVSSFGGSPRRQEIGLGGATAIESLTVVWPVSGLEQTFSDVPLDAFLRIVEGSPGFEVLERPRSPF